MTYAWVGMCGQRERNVKRAWPRWAYNSIC